MPWSCPKSSVHVLLGFCAVLAHLFSLFNRRETLRLHWPCGLFSTSPVDTNFTSPLLLPVSSPPMMHCFCFQDGEPVRPGVAMTDLATGLYAHGAIMAALLQRHRTGRGSHIDCNLLSSQVTADCLYVCVCLGSAGKLHRWHCLSHPVSTGCWFILIKSQKFRPSNLIVGWFLRGTWPHSTAVLESEVLETSVVRLICCLSTCACVTVLLLNACFILSHFHVWLQKSRVHPERSGLFHQKEEMFRFQKHLFRKFVSHKLSNFTV